MGLVGALIVRPAVGAGRAYAHPGTAFDREYLFLLTEMDPAIHAQVYDQVSAGLPVSVDTTSVPSHASGSSTAATPRTRCWTPASRGCRRSRTTACRACTPARGC